MSVNINVLKEIDKNHKKENDLKLKTEEMSLMQVCMYHKGYSESRAGHPLYSVIKELLLGNYFLSCWIF